MSPELLDENIRQSILLQLSTFKRQGYRDLGLVYLGARYALSLGLNKEAVDWLQLLEKPWDKNVVHPTYLPVALLQFLALPVGKGRDTMATLLNDLLRSNHSLRSELSLLYPGFVSTEGTSMGKTANKASIKYKAVRDVGEKLIAGWKKGDETGKKEGEENNQAVNDTNLLNALEGMDISTRLLQLSIRANQYYERNNVELGRYFLEEMLLVDGDQPETLRNLLTICSEQKDVEGYERYWKKYVKLLLWKIFNNNNQCSSRQTLLNFYQRVIILLERECKQSIDRMMEVLNRPGFLNRWIEALAGVIWLKDFRQEAETAKEEESVIPATSYSIPFIRFWLKAFYPEFTNRFHFKPVDKSIKEFGQLVSDPSIELSYSPVVKFLSQYLKWYRFHFGLSKGDNDLLIESIAVYAGFVARMPTGAYLYHLSEVDFEKEEDYYLLEGKPLLDEIKAACSFGIRLWVNHSISTKKKKWPQLAQFLNETNAQELVLSELLMYEAFAVSKSGKALQGLDMAFRVLSGISKEELDDKKYENRGLFLGALNTCIDDAIKKGNKDMSRTVTNLGSLKIKVNAFETAPMLKSLLEEANREIDKVMDHYEHQKRLDQLIKKAMNDIKNRIAVRDYQGAKRIVNSLPNELTKLKENLHAQISNFRLY